jgi:hypothetical protein
MSSCSWWSCWTLNQYRFGENSELMAAWLTARRVMTGPRPEEKEKPPEAPPGEVKPAA